MLWIVTGLWLAAVAYTGWRYLEAPSRSSMVVYLAVGLAGVVPYLWLLLTDQLPRVYSSVMAVVWVAIAAASVVWLVRRQRAGRKQG